jgi:hypothetical protein
MLSRRDFLQLGLLGSPALLLGCALPVRAFAGRSPVNAGLFFGAEDLPRLQTLYRAAGRFAPLRESIGAIDREAERRFMREDVRLNDHLLDLPRLTATAERMAFHYAMTNEDDAAALAAEAIRTLMRFPTWDYFLEAGHHVIGLQRAPAGALAVSLASDWLGDYLDPSERRSWLLTMAERGLEPSFRALYGMRHPERVIGWTMDRTSGYFEHRPDDNFDLTNWPTILDDTNLKAVPATALTVGALAYRDEFGDDDDTRRWLEQAIYSVTTLGDLFTSDGSYDEGVSYAHYTALHVAQATSVLRRRLGNDLYDLINWSGFTTYLREMTMATRAEPTGIVNFGDNSSGATAAVPYWNAGRSFDGKSRWFGDNLAAEYDKWSLIWYPETVAAEAPPDTPHVWISDLDWLVARTGYGPRDLVVAMRSGPPANHEHADRNSLIVKAFGEQLVTDPYRPPYSNSDPAWMMRTTAGHSALLIDGEGHQYHDGSEGTNASDAHARIVRSSEHDGFAVWSSDATQAYHLVNPDVQSVTRTIAVLYEMPAVLVIDKVIKLATPSRLQARFFGYNRDDAGRIEATDHGFRTIRPGVILHAAAHAQDGLTVATGILPIPDEAARQHPFAELATMAPGLTPLLVTALLPQPDDSPAPRVEIRTLGDDSIEVVFANGTREARCQIVDTDAIPEIRVSP